MKALYYSTGRKVVVAESYNELTTKQYLGIVKLLHAGITDETLAYEKALFSVSDKTLFTYFFIPADIRLRMHEHIDWVFEQKEITKQFIPCYKNFYGPAGNFDNLRMREFHAAEMAFYALNEDKNIEALNELIATLYRPGKKDYDVQRDPDGDIRIAYNENEVSYYKKSVAKWPLTIKRAILMWYAGCRQQLEEDYKPAFEGGKSSLKDYFDGMFGIMRSIAEKKTYGDFNAVGDMYAKLAFKEIVETKLDEEELKRQHPELYKK